jgi:predicted nucleotidyltransferase
MSEREIASIINVSHMSINRTMRELSDLNFVNFITVGKAHLWKVNCKSYAYRTLSEFIKEVSQIKNPLNDLITTLLKNLPKTMIERAVLFGSIVKGLEKTNSDIDVFFLVKTKERKEKLILLLDNLSNICLEAYGNRLSPYILTEREMKQKKSLKIISEINKGIQIFPRRR